MIELVLCGHVETPGLAELAAAPRRDSVFFDELLEGYVVLAPPPSLPVALLVVDPVVVSPTAPPQRGQGMVVTEVAHASADATVYRFVLPVRYPKRRPTLPLLKLVATLSFEPAAPQVVREQVLPDTLPVSTTNILGELQFGSSPTEVEMHAKDTKPETVAAEVVSTFVELPASPALSMRLKLTKAAGRDGLLLAVLEIDAASELLERLRVLEVTAIDVTASGADCAALTGWSPPSTLDAGDTLSSLYRLVPQASRTQAVLTFLISSRVGDCVVETGWSTSVDFLVPAPPISSLLRPTKKKPAGRLVSLTSVSSVAKTTRSASSVNVSIPRGPAMAHLSGLQLSFSGSVNVVVGEVFEWVIQATNGGTQPLSLSLYMETVELFEKPQPRVPTVWAAPVPPALLQRTYATVKREPHGVVCLGNDIKIGPLEPGAVFETKMKLVALERGMYSLEGLRLVELGSGEGFDCGRMLEVVVSET